MPGISHQIAYTGTWGAIKTFPKRKPFVTNLIVATLKTSFADIVIQKAEGKDWKDIDWKRNGVFTLFGFAYLGIAQWCVLQFGISKKYIMGFCFFPGPKPWSLNPYPT